MGTIAFSAFKGSVAALTGAALALLLAACGTTLEVSRFYASPGLFDAYTCPQIADQMVTLETEGRRLEGLMAKADREASGVIVSRIAYEPDYLANRGQVRELQKASATKKCPNLPPPAPASPGTTANPVAATPLNAPPVESGDDLFR